MAYVTFNTTQQRNIEIQMDFQDFRGPDVHFDENDITCNKVLKSLTWSILCGIVNGASKDLA